MSCRGHARNRGAAWLLLLLVAGAAAGCSYAGQSSPRNDSITGTVTYRERVALPPDAVVRVVLIDASIQDVQAPEIAATELRPAGRQVPLSFELRYDPGRIDPKHVYAVRATIRSAGELLFTTDQAYPVITRGHATHANLQLVAVRPGAGHPGDALRGGRWLLEDLGGAGVIDNVQATLAFPEAGKVAGSGSCNRFTGSVTISASSINFSPLATTRMACVPAVMNQESRYLRALQGATRYEVRGSTLLIWSATEPRPLRFTRAAP